MNIDGNYFEYLVAIALKCFVCKGMMEELLALSPKRVANVNYRNTKEEVVIV